MNQESYSETEQMPPTKPEELKPFLGACFHRANSSGQADLFDLVGEYEGWILKDFSGRPWAFRVLVNRRIIKREIRALIGLQPLEGVPRYGGAVGRDAYLMKRLNADRLPHKRDGIPSCCLFDRIDQLVADMHNLGWAHGDLRRTNILMDEDERPYLIDFATAWNAPEGAWPLRKWLFRRWQRVDLTNMARIKEAYCPDYLTENDKALLCDRPKHLSVGRFIRKKLYRPLKRKHRKETWRKIKGLFSGEK